MFLEDDEFIILMDLNKDMPGNWGAMEHLNPLTIEERIKVRSAGVKTALEYPQWKVMERVQGQYNFSTVEEFLRRNRAAGLKTIFSICGVDYPDWMPDDWFAKTAEGKVYRVQTSFWNAEAQECADIFYRYFMEMFSAPDVSFIFGECENGEALLPCEPSFFDRAAINSFQEFWNVNTLPIGVKDGFTREWLETSAIAHVLKRQSRFAFMCGEVWNMQQLLFNQWSEATLNYTHKEIMRLLRVMMKDKPIVYLQYTYFDDAHKQDNVEYVDSIKNEFGCEVIAEAHFCRGLRTTTPQSIAKGFRGQILCPTHPISGCPHYEDWMTTEISWAHNLWKESRQK